LYAAAAAAVCSMPTHNIVMLFTSESNKMHTKQFSIKDHIMMFYIGTCLRQFAHYVRSTLLRAVQRKNNILQTAAAVLGTK